LLLAFGVLFYFKQLLEPQLGPGAESDKESAAVTQYSSVSYQGHEYKIGDCAYFAPTSFEFSIKVPAVSKKIKYDSTDVRSKFSQIWKTSY
jgi:hypothetical protein